MGHSFIAFVIASILFIQVPGPSLLFTIGRALTVGRTETLLSVLGNASYSLYLCHPFVLSAATIASFVVSVAAMPFDSARYCPNSAPVTACFLSIMCT